MNKNLTLIALCVASSACFAEDDGIANFQPPVMLTTVDGNPVDSDGWTVPYVVDVDGDGKKDLLVGQFMNAKRPWPRKADEFEDGITAGTVRYYRNISTGTTPEYAAGVDLQADDGPVYAPNWCCSGVSPQLVDWNGDGYRDLLVGGFDGGVMYFAGKKGGNFSAGKPLHFENGNVFLHPPILSEYGKKLNAKLNRPQQPAEEDAAAGIWVTDWDGDGDLDIVSGWFYGGLFVSRNNGTPTEPKLSSEFELINAGGKSLTEVFQTEPCIADWDGDGRDDLIYGTRNAMKTNDGAVYWCRNTADKGDPVYEFPRKLVDAGPESQLVAPSLGRNRAFGSALTVSVIDWEGDGDLDLLVGDYAAVQQTRDDITSAQFEELLNLQAQGNEIRNELDAAEDMAVRKSMNEKYFANLKSQKEYLKPPEPRSDSRSVGRVWLLIRE